MQQSKIQQADQVYELASALADGELQGDELLDALRALESRADAQVCWHDYHLVGDVLRVGAHAALGAYDASFVSRLRQRLHQGDGHPQVAGVLSDRVGASHSANDSVWRWKLVAGLSSLAVVGVLAWQLVVPPPQAAQMAANVPVPAPLSASALPVAGEAPIMIRDPRLDQLIAAHQQLGGTSALQMPAGFLRNATFERPSR
jgi:sigma-E factor negative regulatory protein RseA